MNRNSAFRLGTVTLVTLLMIGCQSSGSGTPSTEPSASSAPSAQSFTSTMHGISVSYPESWTAQAATEPWTDSTFPLSFEVPQVDWLYDPTLRAALFLAIASQPIGDSTPQDWVAEQMASDEGCGTATEPITVDGGSGLIGDGCTVAVVTTAGRGYWIQLYTGSEAPATYDQAWFEEVLATVQLQPEDAVGSASLDPNDTSVWLPFVSERYGLSLAYPPDWSAHPGNGDWTFPEDTAWPDGVERTDWFYFEPRVDPSVAASAWSVALEPGTSADQWWLDYCAVEVTPCDGSESKVAASLDGQAGWLFDASDPAAYFGVGDRIYLLTVWQPDDFVTLERYGGGLAFIETWLSTMRLMPD